MKSHLRYTRQLGRISLVVGLALLCAMPRAWAQGDAEKEAHLRQLAMQIMMRLMMATVGVRVDFKAPAVVSKAAEDAAAKAAAAEAAQRRTHDELGAISYVLSPTLDGSRQLQDLRVEASWKMVLWAGDPNHSTEARTAISDVFAPRAADVLLDQDSIRTLGSLIYLRIYESLVLWHLSGATVYRPLTVSNYPLLRLLRDNPFAHGLFFLGLDIFNNSSFAGRIFCDKVLETLSALASQPNVSGMAHDPVRDWAAYNLARIVGDLLSGVHPRTGSRYHADVAPYIARQLSGNMTNPLIAIDLYRGLRHALRPSPVAPLNTLEPGLRRTLGEFLYGAEDRQGFIEVVLSRSTTDDELRVQLLAEAKKHLAEPEVSATDQGGRVRFFENVVLPMVEEKTDDEGIGERTGSGPSARVALLEMLTDGKLIDEALAKLRPKTHWHDYVATIFENNDGVDAVAALHWLRDHYALKQLIELCVHKKTLWAKIHTSNNPELVALSATTLVDMITRFLLGIEVLPADYNYEVEHANAVRIGPAQANDNRLAVVIPTELYSYYHSISQQIQALHRAMTNRDPVFAQEIGEGKTRTRRGQKVATALATQERRRFVRTAEATQASDMEEAVTRKIERVIAIMEKLANRELTGSYDHTSQILPLRDSAAQLLVLLTISAYGNSQIERARDTLLRFYPPGRIMLLLSWVEQQLEAEKTLEVPPLKWLGAVDEAESIPVREILTAPMRQHMDGKVGLLFLPPEARSGKRLRTLNELRTLLVAADASLARPRDPHYKIDAIETENLRRLEKAVETIERHEKVAERRRKAVARVDEMDERAEDRARDREHDEGRKASGKEGEIQRTGFYERIKLVGKTVTPQLTQKEPELLEVAPAPLPPPPPSPEQIAAEENQAKIDLCIRQILQGKNDRIVLQAADRLVDLLNKRRAIISVETVAAIRAQAMTLVRALNKPYIAERDRNAFATNLETALTKREGMTPPTGLASAVALDAPEVTGGSVAVNSPEFDEYVAYLQAAGADVQRVDAAEHTCFAPLYEGDDAAECGKIVVAYTHVNDDGRITVYLPADIHAIARADLFEEWMHVLQIQEAVKRFGLERVLKSIQRNPGGWHVVSDALLPVLSERAVTMQQAHEVLSGWQAAGKLAAPETPINHQQWTEIGEIYRFMVSIGWLRAQTLRDPSRLAELELIFDTAQSLTRRIGDSLLATPDMTARTTFFRAAGLLDSPEAQTAFFAAAVADSSDDLSLIMQQCTEHNGDLQTEPQLLAAAPAIKALTEARQGLSMRVETITTELTRSAQALHLTNRLRLVP